MLVWLQVETLGTIPHELLAQFALKILPSSLLVPREPLPQVELKIFTNSILAICTAFCILAAHPVLLHPCIARPP